MLWIEFLHFTSKLKKKIKFISTYYKDEIVRLNHLLDTEYKINFTSTM